MSAVKRALVAVLAVVAFMVAGVLDAPADARPVVDWSICPSALGENARCVWDGRHMGDGRGPSFVTYGEHVGGVFVIRRERVSHKRAHKLVRRILCDEYGWRCGR